MEEQKVSSFADDKRLNIQERVGLLSQFVSEDPTEKTIFLGDGGIETWLIFVKNYELREFASFEAMLDDKDKGMELCLQYYKECIKSAEANSTSPFLFRTPTWRASPDFLATLNYPAGDEEVIRVNEEVVQRLLPLRDATIFSAQSKSEKKEKETSSEHARAGKARMLLAGMVGPRGDGYQGWKTGARMSPEDAQAYHTPQITGLQQGGVDLISCETVTEVNEAVGLARACAAAGLKCLMSFTVETDGKLADGKTLQEAIAEVDKLCGPQAEPTLYSINCAHPSHITKGFPVATQEQNWASRVAGIFVNASSKSHAELDEATELDAGDPNQLGAQCVALQKQLKLRILGGCCGTDARHINAIAHALQ